MAAQKGRRWPSGGTRIPPRLGWGIAQGWVDGHRHKNAEPISAGSARIFKSIGRYAAAFFVGFDDNLGADFLVALTFSFATNSCFTFAEMASTSTL